MRPVTAQELIALDKNRMEVVVLQQYPIPEQVVYQAAKNDYSEIPIHHQDIPPPSECGKWIVEQLLKNDRGHWGPLEHPSITLSTSGFVHNVMVQARTHRVGISFDVQSQRYTGRRVLGVADRAIPVDDVFYIRPPGYYANRKGKKYEWTQADYDSEIEHIYESCVRYAERYRNRMSEEHIRDYLPQCIRQNFVISFNLRSALHFMDLRSKLDAQLEIQALCERIVPHLKAWAPNVWEYYEEKRLHRAKLSP
jgi:thymidylate synthase (FAD)